MKSAPACTFFCSRSGRNSPGRAGFTPRTRARPGGRHQNFIREVIARSHALTTLVLDEGKYAQSWEQSAEGNRNAISKNDFVQVYERLYKNHGKLTSRGFVDRSYESAPAGEFVDVDAEVPEQ